MPSPFAASKRVGKALIRPATILPRQGMLFLQRRTSRRNALLVLRLILILIGLIVLHTVVFRYLMELEGRHFSWATSLYWTFSNMTTLGLGDIIFRTDAGRLYTIFALLTGLSFILVLLPFTLIQLFQSPARVHRELPPETSGHVILTHVDPVTSALVERLEQFQVPYVYLVPDLDDALALSDRGIRTVTGNLDDPETYRKVRAMRASLVATTGMDETNAAVTFAVRQAAPDVPVFASAVKHTAEKVLRVAGSSRVIRFEDTMAAALARRITAGDALAHVIGHIDDLAIAEATASGTPLMGKTLAEAKLEELVGLHVIGAWEHGSFVQANPEVRISSRMVLLLAGDQAAIDRYNELFCIYNAAAGPIVIVGKGKVGSALGQALQLRELDYTIIERSMALEQRIPHLIPGDASDPAVLDKAHIGEAPAVVLTSRDDHENIFLATLIRDLRPDVQILSRVTLERTVPLLHKAGCDFVLSYASMGANSIFNMLRSGSILMIAEGLDVFKVGVPRSLRGKALRRIRQHDLGGCSLVGLVAGGTLTLHPDPAVTLSPDASLILIGTLESERRFFTNFGGR